MSLLKILIFYSFFLSTLFVSCGPGNGDKSIAPAIGETLRAQGPIESFELQVAMDLCQTLRGKRYNYANPTYTEKSFKFILGGHSCQNKSFEESTISTDLRQRADSTTLYFHTSYGGRAPAFISTVETDTDGNVSPFCRKILKGEAVENTYKSGVDEYTQVYFLDREGHYEFVSVRSRKISGLDKVINKTTLKISKDQGLKKSGLVTEFLDESSCVDSGGIQKISRIYSD